MCEQAKQMKSKQLTLRDVLDLYHVPPHLQIIRIRLHAIAYDDVDRSVWVNFSLGFLAGALGALLACWWWS